MTQEFRNCVLVVDDEVEIRKLLFDILYQYNVCTVESVDEAIKFIKNGDCDVVLSDLRMPGKSVLELLEFTKSYQPDIPLILVTGFSTKEIQKDFFQRGVYDCIEKPFEEEDIIQVVARALNKRKLDIEARAHMRELINRKLKPQNNKEWNLTDNYASRTIDRDYEFVKKLVLEKSGLDLGDDRQYLIDSRLQPLIAALGFESITKFLEKLRLDRDNAPLIRILVESLCTNETLFFRDFTPFEILRDTILPDLIQNRLHKRRLVIWSAACSTGQEPYSIAMTILNDFPELSTWDVKILATDISNDALEGTKTGCYTELEVSRGLPKKFRDKFFTKRDRYWKIDEKVKALVEVRPLNLLPPIDLIGAFDIIFCRNVLIYFQKDLKTKVLNELSRLISQDGYLFLGGAESTLGLTDEFEKINDNMPSVYKKVVC